MTSGNSKWVRAILTTAVILAITAMMAPAMAQTYIFYSIPPYNASGYVVTLWSNGTVGAPFTPVEVYLGGTYLTTVSLNSTGGLYAQVMLPYGLKAGSYTFYVVNTTAGIVNYSLYPFELKFSISPGFASKGQTVTLNVTGQGFKSGETVNIYLISPTGATTVIYTATATNGFINVTFTVPSSVLSSAGKYYIEAVGQTSGVTYLAPFYVTTASVSPQYLAVYNGYSYTLSGSNYPSGTYVDVCFNGAVVNSFKLGTANFTTTIPIPYNLPQGNYSVVAITTPSPVPSGAPCPGTNETYEGGYATATWTVVPQIVLSPTQACPESTVDIYLYGFPANTGINIYVNGTSYINVTTNQYGTYEVSYTPPEPGTYEFTTNYTYTYSVVGSLNKSATYPIPAYLRVSQPTISISPSEQIVGGFVTISGVCFPPNEQVQVYINSVSVTGLAIQHINATSVGIGPISTNSTGGFSSLYVVPLLPPGTYKVSVNVSGVLSSNTVYLTIPAPSIALNTTSIYEGGPIGFTGQNFANFTWGYSMTIKFEPSGYTATCQNNTPVPFGPSGTGTLYCTMFSNGTVTGYIIMPVVQPGTYTVYFNSTYSSSSPPFGAGATTPGSGTNDTLYTTANITMQASYIVVTPSPAPAGAPISVTGYNFYPGTAVTIIVNGTNVTSVKVRSNGMFTASNVYTVPSYIQTGVLYIVAEENYSTYIAGTPPNAVGIATATVNITNVNVVIINLLNEVLGNLTSMNATLTAVYNAVQSMSSELSTVYNAVLSMNSTLQSMSSTLSNIQSTLSSMQSTLSTISSDVQLIPALLGQVSTIISDLSNMNATLMNIYDVVSTLNLTVIQNELSTINSNVLSVNSTLTTYAGQVLSNLYNIENTLSTMQSTMSSQYSTIQGELGAIESTLVSMNTTISKISTVPSVVSGSGSYTFTSPGTYTIYQGSGVAQITVTLYYTGYTTMYIYVYPIPGDTTHIVKLQVTSSTGYTVTVSGWRVDIYVTSASTYSPVTVYYAYTATS